MMNKTYRTGGLTLCLSSDVPVNDADFFPLFRVDDDMAPDHTVRVLRQPLPQPEGVEILRTNHRRRVVADGTAYDYTFFSDAEKLEHIPYACAVRQGAQITLFVDYAPPFWDTMLFDAIGLPDLFLENDAAIVHASFVGVGGKGILFAGPKRQGKSTQAELWKRHKNAVVINGDRAAVRASGGETLACSVPFCGSSRVCLNMQLPVRAIVFPEKGERNFVTPLSPMESFLRLIGCISYTQEDPAAKERALLIAERIVSSNTCLRLVCRPDAGAVEALASALGLGNGDMRE